MKCPLLFASQSHPPRSQRYHPCLPEPSQVAFDWSLHGGPDDACLSDGDHLKVVVLEHGDAGCHAQAAEVLGLGDVGCLQVLTLHHPSLWRCHTVHALDADKLRRTSGHLGRAV